MLVLHLIHSAAKTQHPAKQPHDCVLVSFLAHARNKFVGLWSKSTFTFPREDHLTFMALGRRQLWTQKEEWESLPGEVSKQESSSHFLPPNVHKIVCSWAAGTDHTWCGCGNTANLVLCSLWAHILLIWGGNESHFLLYCTKNDDFRDIPYNCRCSNER